jgi:hypothetical protein
LGQGADGVKGASTTSDGRGGFGGSGGGNAVEPGTSTTASSFYSTTVKSTPGIYGGGAGGSENGTGEFNNGASGAVRIIWAGTRPGDVSRSFPSTNTGDL